ncbi:MAG: LPS export ABC transporter periplasmic protein LptC [Alphaproteobacteria bacterium]
MANAALDINTPDWRQARALPGSGEDPRRRLIMRLVKYVLPAIAMVFLALMIAWPRLFEEQSKFELTASEVSAAKDDLRMNSPSFTGMGTDNRPYRVTADTAVQDLNDHELVRLETLQADLSMQDGSWLSVNANGGLMHNGLQTLQLDGQIEAYSDLGYAFYTESALVDLDAGSLVSDRPVRLQGPYGHLRAKTMRATQRGQHLHFAGDVKVIIFPRSGGAG